MSILDLRHPMEKTTSEEAIKYYKDKIKNIKRAQRKDAGQKRPKYTTKLPARYKSYLLRANKKQVPFTLTVDEFNALLNQPCIYCGSTAKTTIDRTDSSDGYTIENCSPCCFQCNIMKMSATHEDFLKKVRQIYRYNNFDA